MSDVDRLIADASEVKLVPGEVAIVNCGRCGRPITVSDPEILRILKTRPVPMYHSVCTDSSAPLRKFRVRLLVEEVKSVPKLDENGEQMIDEAEGQPIFDEDVESLTGFKADAEGDNFMGAFPALERKLGDLWTKVREHGPVIDALGDGDEKPKAPPSPPASKLVVPR